MEERQSSGFDYLGPIVFLWFLNILGMPIWAIAILAAWYFLLIHLENNGTLDDWNATRAMGFILMIRTQRGKILLDKISQYRKFWRAYGEFSIWLCFLMMFGVIFLLVATAVFAAIQPPQQSLPAKDLLLIPGVTSFVPFWWPVIALIVALVIHEYSHGIQARVHGMRLRSFGLLLAGPLPMGAFAEPELEEIVRAPRRERIRLYAAGPSINIVATYLVLIILSATASGFVAQDEGVHARAIIDDTGASEAGLLPYEIITHIDGQWVPDFNSFSHALDQSQAGDMVMISVLSHENENGQREARRISVTLTDQRQYYLGMCEGEQACLDDTAEILDLWGIYEGNAFLGVSGLSAGTSGVDYYELSTVEDSGLVYNSLSFFLRPLSIMGIPIINDGQTMALEERALIKAGDGFVASSLGTEGMLGLFDFLFWLAWINFILGFANLIPMIPFDGGHIVHDTIHSTIAMLSKKMHPMQIESLAGKISNFSSIGMLIIVLFPILLPKLI